MENIFISNVKSITCPFSSAGSGGRRVNRTNHAIIFKFEGETIYCSNHKTYISNAENIAFLPKDCNYSCKSQVEGHFYSIEFEGNINNVLARRNVPITHEEIAEYQRQRSAFNHMTVMYKKSTVLKAGNYEHCALMEDDMMWIRMLIVGAKCANVDDYLVYARTGYAMIERRGGWTYFKKYRNGRKQIYNTGYI